MTRIVLIVIVALMITFFVLLSYSMMKIAGRSDEVLNRYWNRQEDRKHGSVSGRKE